MIYSVVNFHKRRINKILMASQIRLNKYKDKEYQIIEIDNLTWICACDDCDDTKCIKCIKSKGKKSVEMKIPRYILGAFIKYTPAPKKVLICFGLNPNTGVPDNLEKTVKAIQDFVDGMKSIMDGSCSI